MMSMSSQKYVKYIQLICSGSCSMGYKRLVGLCVKISSFDLAKSLVTIVLNERGVFFHWSEPMSNDHVPPVCKNLHDNKYSWLLLLAINWLWAGSWPTTILFLSQHKSLPFKSALCTYVPLGFVFNRQFPKNFPKMIKSNEYTAK